MASRADCSGPTPSDRLQNSNLPLVRHARFSTLKGCPSLAPSPPRGFTPDSARAAGCRCLAECWPEVRPTQGDINAGRAEKISTRARPCHTRNAKDWLVFNTRFHAPTPGLTLSSNRFWPRRVHPSLDRGCCECSTRSLRSVVADFRSRAQSLCSAARVDRRRVPREWVLSK